MRVLLVEDDNGCRSLLEHLLEPYSSRLVATTKLVECLEHLSDEDWDAIILDLNLPDSRAPQTLKTIRQIKSFRPRTAVIVVSGIAPFEKTKDDAIKNGADAFVPKTQAMTQALLIAVSAIVFQNPQPGREPTFYEHAAALNKITESAVQA